MTYRVVEYKETPLTEETVERLRKGGASPDLIAFADRHVVRYSRAQMDSGQNKAFWLGILIGVAVLVLVGFITGLPA